MATIKVRYKRDWVDPDDLPFLREQDRQATTPPAPLDVATLPADVPLAQLGDRCPAVRRYLTAEGKVRSGLKPSEEAIAQEILSRYEPNGGHKT